MRVFKTLFLVLVAVGLFKPAYASTPADFKRVAVVLVLDDDDDAARTVTTVFTTMMAAEKIAQLLDVELTVSDAPISDDVFVFSLKSKDEKALAMKLLDEEGFEVADNVFVVDQGNNYKQLNVQSLPDGTYKFVVSDNEGKEVTSEVVIERGRKVNH